MYDSSFNFCVYSERVRNVCGFYYVKYYGYEEEEEEGSSVLCLLKELKERRGS